MQDDEAYSPLYSFYGHPFPLASWAELGIAVRGNVADPSKLYVKSNDGRFHGGKYKDGWVTARIRELGVAYSLSYDDKAPEISAVGHSSWCATRNIRVRVSDAETGVKSLQGFVDGKFVLFERLDKTDIYECKLPETPLRRVGRQRQLVFVAVDNRGNEAVMRERIEY